jgi:hypothetical protein
MLGILPVNPEGGKAPRAMAISPLIEAGERLATASTIHAVGG